MDLFLNIAKYKPLRGGTYIVLPKELASKKAIINPKNDDQMCFKWAIIAALNPMKDAQRVSKLKKFVNCVKDEGINYPMKISDVCKFEKMNNLSINIFGCDKKFSIYPIQISKAKGKAIDVLYIHKQEKSHYCWIKDFNKLMFSFNKFEGKKHFCRRCLHCFTTEELLKKHGKDCSENQSSKD